MQACAIVSSTQTYGRRLRRQKWANTPYVATTITIGLADVLVTLPQDGDVLRWSDGRWRNYPETNVTDGGNF
jgi:hypothetical protein